MLPPLALAAMIMLAIDPAVVSSISFQLSFAAVLGIALLSARFAVRDSDWIQSSVRIPTITKRLLTGVVYGMSVSLAATIATAPLVAFHFGEFQLWSACCDRWSVRSRNRQLRFVCYREICFFAVWACER